MHRARKTWDVRPVQRCSEQKNSHVERCSTNVDVEKTRNCRSSSSKKRKQRGFTDRLPVSVLFFWLCQELPEADGSCTVVLTWHGAVTILLVGGDWNMTFIFFHSVGNSHPNWRTIFFGGVETTNQLWLYDFWVNLITTSLFSWALGILLVNKGNHPLIDGRKIQVSGIW